MTYSRNCRASGTKCEQFCSSPSHLSCTHATYFKDVTIFVLIHIINSLSFHHNATTTTKASNAPQNITLTCSFPEDLHSQENFPYDSRIHCDARDSWQRPLRMGPLCVHTTPLLTSTRYDPQQTFYIPSYVQKSLDSGRIQYQSRNAPFSIRVDMAMLR